MDQIPLIWNQSHVQAAKRQKHNVLTLAKAFTFFCCSGKEYKKCFGNFSFCFLATFIWYLIITGNYHAHLLCARVRVHCICCMYNFSFHVSVNKLDNFHSSHTRWYCSRLHCYNVRHMQLDKNSENCIRFLFTLSTFRMYLQLLHIVFYECALCVHICTKLNGKLVRFLRTTTKIP